MIFEILLKGYLAGLITGIIVTAVIGVLITKNEKDCSNQ